MATDAALRDLALRYAAGKLTAVEAAAFEARLASDPQAREAVAEAVCLSAAVLQCPPPSPDPSFRVAACERIVHPHRPRWLTRRAYHGHPLFWTALGASSVAAVAVAVIAFFPPYHSGSPSANPPPLPALAPSPSHPTDSPLPPGNFATVSTPADEPPTLPPTDSVAQASSDDVHATVAELWADMSTPERVEKACDEERRWRQKVRDLTFHPPYRPHATAAATTDEPR